MPESLSVPFNLGVLFLAAAAVSWILNRRHRWVPVGRLSNLYIYPLKSGKYIELPEAECTSLGLKYVPDEGHVPLRDRVFVVYDEETMEFITGKNNPKMVFITVHSKSGNTVVFSYPDRKDVEVVLPDSFKGEAIKLWCSEKVRTVDCGDEIAHWVSDIVRGKSTGLRVGYWPESETWRRDVESLRPNEMTVFKKLSNMFTGAYSDLSSYLLINSNSVQELNERIKDPKKCGVINFRPNLVIDGVEAFAEDKWDWIKIGDAVFRTFRPCTRCSFTTINPQTGVKHEQNEPIKTLKTYRTMKMLGENRVDPHIPVMGVYVGLYQPGTIRPGDTVYIST